MKRQGLFNAPISTLLAELGHTDTLVLADAGLPIPPGVPRIDLALRPRYPSFLNVLDTVLDELCTQGAILASEVDERNANLRQAIERRLADQEHRDSCLIERRLIAHKAFKREIINARSVIRTGECTLFTNIILRSGVPF